MRDGSGTFEEVELMSGTDSIRRSAGGGQGQSSIDTKAQQRQQDYESWKEWLPSPLGLGYSRHLQEKQSKTRHRLTT